MFRLATRPVLVAALLVAGPALAQQRLPTIAPEQYTAEQKKAAEEFLAARKVPVFGPFEPMMYSPEVMSIARATGDYLRYHSAIGNTLSELVILITAREWSQDYEWYVHQPIALKAGLSKEIADAIGDGRRPVGMSTDEEIVYDFAIELLKNKRVSDATFDRADQRFGKKGVVDMAGIVGYYTFLAMQLNMARYQFSSEGPLCLAFQTSHESALLQVADIPPTGTRSAKGHQRLITLFAPTLSSKQATYRRGL